MSGKGILIESLDLMDKRIKILKLKKEIEKLEDELAGAREEIVMLHKALTPKEQAMARAAMDRAFEEE